LNGIYHCNRSQVQGFKVPFLSPDCIWDAYLREKRQLRHSSGLKQNLEPNRQLFAKMSIFDEDFRSLMLPLLLTLNAEL